MVVFDVYFIYKMISHIFSILRYCESLQKKISAFLIYSRFLRLGRSFFGLSGLRLKMSGPDQLVCEVSKEIKQATKPGASEHEQNPVKIKHKGVILKFSATRRCQRCTIYLSHKDAFLYLDVPHNTQITQTVAKLYTSVGNTGISH